LPVRRLGGYLAGHTDLLDVTMVGAAAAAEHVDLRVPPLQGSVLTADLPRISVVKIRRLIELLMAISVLLLASA
jgi:hypothetical protein